MSKQKVISGAEFRKKYTGKPLGQRGVGRESELQQSCVKWFRLAYPQYRSLLISVPNSGAESAQRGARLKREGLMPGASDLMLLVGRGGWNGLAIEIKTLEGRVSQHQRDWGVQVLESGYLYVVVRSFDSFRNLVDGYLNL